MNGFVDHGLDEAAFGEKGGFTNNLRTFDAFRKLSIFLFLVVVHEEQSVLACRPPDSSTLDCRTIEFVELTRYS